MTAASYMVDTKLQFASAKVPAVVEAELLLEAEKSSHPERMRRDVEMLLSPFEVVPFDSCCARHYAQVRAFLECEGKLIGPNDLLIAATALLRSGTRHQ